MDPEVILKMYVEAVRKLVVALEKYVLIVVQKMVY